MKKVKYKHSTINPVHNWEGEPIELKVERILTNNEPITDGAPIIYNDKKDGVNPAHNIRTDRWEIATETMNIVHKSKIAKSESKAEKPKNETPKGDGTSN